MNIKQDIARNLPIDASKGACIKVTAYVFPYRLYILSLFSVTLPWKKQQLTARFRITDRYFSPTTNAGAEFVHAVKGLKEEIVKEFKYEHIMGTGFPKFAPTDHNTPRRIVETLLKNKYVISVENYTPREGYL